MQVIKYKLTAISCSGFMILVYVDGHFKSVVNEFNPVISDRQLRFILGNLPDDPSLVIATYEAIAPGKIVVEKTIEPTDLPDPVNEVLATNKKVAMWCSIYEEITKVKYKTNKAEAGKLARLSVNALDFGKLLRVYFTSDAWYLKPKSVSNFIVKYNEIRALAFAAPSKKSYPLPYSEAYDAKLTHQDRIKYWQYLRDNGYSFVDNGRVRTWVKRETY